jgi:DNA invertase Pin-like site-specific DNA recombinase
MKVAIFARVSTTDRQTTDRQVNDLLALCANNAWTVVETITEQVSGAKANSDRAGVQALFDLARRRSINKIVVTEISRIGRNVSESVQIIETLTACGVSLYIQNIGMETLLADGRANFMFKPILLTLVGFAEMERELLRERIKSGLDTARRRGQKLGRPTGVTETTDEVLDKYPRIVRELRAGMSVRKAAKICDVSPNTVQKVKQALTARAAA